MQNTVLFLNILDSGLSTNLAPLAQGRYRLAQVFVLLLQTLQLNTRNREGLNREVRLVVGRYLSSSGKESSVEVLTKKYSTKVYFD